MDLDFLEKVKKIWNDNGGELIKPKYYIAIDKIKDIYYVIMDSSCIIYLIKNDSNSTYVLPKKYMKINKKGYYVITNESKMKVISCQKKNKYELFVQKKLIGKNKI